MSSDDEDYEESLSIHDGEEEQRDTKNTPAKIETEHTSESTPTEENEVVEEQEENKTYDYTNYIEELNSSRPKALSIDLLCLSTSEEHELIEKHKSLLAHSNPLESYIGSLIGVRDKTKDEVFETYVKEKFTHEVNLPERRSLKLGTYESPSLFEPEQKLISDSMKATLIEQMHAWYIRNSKTHPQENLIKPSSSTKPVQQRPTRTEPAVNTTAQTQSSIRYSTLTAAEHKEFLEMNALTILNALPQSRLNRFFELREQVDREVNEYKRHIFNDTMSTIRIERYKHIDPIISQNVEPIMESKRQRVLKYPRYYKHCVNVNETKQIEKTIPKFEFESEVLRFGKCYILNPPTVVNAHNSVSVPPPDTPIYNSNLYTIQPTDATTFQNSVEKWEKRSMVDLSEDPILQTRIQDFDIAISSSSLEKLIHNFLSKDQEECTIPLTITAPSTTSKSKIIIDKPLLKKKYTLREKNGFYYKLMIQRLARSNQFIDYNKNNFNEQQSNDKMEDSSVDVDNVVYNKFKLGDLNIIVRCRHHGYTRGLKPTQVNLRVHMEYHTDRALEVPTNLEEASWYMHTLIRPQSSLLFARVDAISGNVVHVEQKRLESITPPTPIVIEQLYSLLQHLSQFAPGNYLLVRRNDSEEEKFSVFYAVDSLIEEDSYDLHQDYSKAGVNDLVTIPYVPYWSFNVQPQVRFTFPVSKNPNVYKTNTGKRKRKKKHRGGASSEEKNSKKKKLNDP